MAEANQTVWTRKDLIGIADLSRGEIELVLDTAPQFVAVSQRASGIKKVPLLQGRLVVTWFHEPSTRTRSSFELAAKRLSADTLAIASSTSSSVKGETLHDTLANIEAMRADIIVLRHGCAGAPHLLAAGHASHIVNAGDGRHEHPTQALLDCFTMRDSLRRRLGNPEASLDGLKVAIVGDVEHSRVARSDIHALKKLGAEVVLCGPSTLIPRGVEQMGVTVTHKLREALADADVVYSLRIQLERQAKALFPSLREYIKLFRIDAETLKFAPDHAIVMHPGPINRDLELSTEVADGPRSVILQQVTNGVAIRMAVMHLLANSAAARA
ncbi:MAG: aspartate carbamoyltransferase catalytic subunit [Candidatus Hydrogenedens sp.]|nr:aspartate carbamoyltransferase catalytic subunit [Candidatus Hydrogenedentota bacterium]NLF58631.1 aspartate carbamoyltransferase catalytic subunit [Candidatus Hydrogenedens sp.]